MAEWNKIKYKLPVGPRQLRRLVKKQHEKIFGDAQSDDELKFSDLSNDEDENCNDNDNDNVKAQAEQSSVELFRKMTEALTKSTTNLQMGSDIMEGL